jgi:phage-related protein
MRGVRVKRVVFFRTATGLEPVRDFLRELDAKDRLVVGTDLQTVQRGFPIGMPVCRPLGKGLFEVRSSLPSKREVRLIFIVEDQDIILIHSLVKKTQKTPSRDLQIAFDRQQEYISNLRRRKHDA